MPCLLKLKTSDFQQLDVTSNSSRIKWFP